MHTVGSTVVVMERFDATAALGLLLAEDITVSQWVPTMFRRLLQLPEEIRGAFAAPLHQQAWHAAAPCPRPVKEQMLAWWGPVLWEYYSGSEGGGTVISPQEWLTRPGSVGRHWRGGATYVLDADTKEPVPAGTEGLIFFEAFATYRFVYHNDPEKTASTYHGNLITLGDIGYLDDDGYLFLTDRQSDMIVSGGVNIYPREVEETLLSHPAVQDAAVFGIPDPSSASGSSPACSRPICRLITASSSSRWTSTAGRSWPDSSAPGPTGSRRSCPGMRTGSFTNAASGMSTGVPGPAN